MKLIKLACTLYFLATVMTFGQDITMTGSSHANDEALNDILRFENIEYHTVQFTGTELKGKPYRIVANEIWDGKIISDTVIFDSKRMGIPQFAVLKDTTLSFKVLAKRTPKNQLKMNFMFPRFGTTKYFDALETDEYSLRNLITESNLPVKIGEEFYLMAYILPYEREDGSKSWCEVGTNGRDVENWGEKFNIKHYLLIKMCIDCADIKS